MLDWFSEQSSIYWIINLGVPLAVLAFNVSQRGFSVSGATAPSDWILLLAGVDFAAVALMSTGKAPPSVGALGPSVVIVGVLGLCAHSLSRRWFEPRVTRAVEGWSTQENGSLPKTMAAGRVLWEYFIAMMVPTIWTIVHMFMYVTGGWNG